MTKLNPLRKARNLVLLWGSVWGFSPAHAGQMTHSTGERRARIMVDLRLPAEKRRICRELGAGLQNATWSRSTAPFVHFSALEQA